MATCQWLDVDEWKAAQEDPSQHQALTKAAAAVCAVHVQAMLDLQDMGIPATDYGNNIRQVAFDEGVKDALTSQVLSRLYPPAVLPR